MTEGRVYAILFALLALFCIVVKGCEYKDSFDRYNNGNCPCGGHIHYEQAIGHKYTTHFIYRCDKCGRRLELCYDPEYVPVEADTDIEVEDEDSWMTEVDYGRED